MADPLIKDLLNKYSDDLKPDREKLKEVVEFYVNFLQLNESHLSFFGGNLIGVYPVRWPTQLRHEWLDTVCQIIDIQDLTTEFHAISEIEPGRHVTGNIFNYTFLWLANKFFTSKQLSVKDQYLGAHTVLCLLQIRYLTGLDREYFKYPAKIEIAQAMYEDLTKKSLIKRFGSWRAVIEYRATRILDFKAKDIKTTKDRENTITKLEPNDSVIRQVADIQNMVRRGYIALSVAFHEHHKANTRIESKSAYQSIDGEAVLSDIKNKTAQIRSEMKDICSRRSDFILEDYVEEVCENLMTTCSRDNLVKVLTFINENAQKKNKRFDISDEIADLTIYVHEYIRVNRMNPKDIENILISLRATFKAWKTDDNIVVNLRDKLETIVDKVVPIRGGGVKSGVKIATMVYLALRILGLSHS